MSEDILITGGAGWIGSHLADELLAHGYRVRVLDNLTGRAHGSGQAFPDYLDPAVETRHGDVRDARAVREALDGIDAVVHLVPAVGADRDARGDHANTVHRSTAVLLEALSTSPTVARLVVGSSLSVYGEGLYRDRQGGTCIPMGRGNRQLQVGYWDLNDGANHAMAPLPTPEENETLPASLSALCHLDQERLCLRFARTHGLSTAVLRFFNVYGPRKGQANGAGGVPTWFFGSYLKGEAPRIFEDGRQLRDFVHVHDVAVACRLALENPQAGGEIFNIGSGECRSVLDLARRAAEALGSPRLRPAVTGHYRAGDVRHCFADIAKARRVLGYRPRVSLEAGLLELAGWLERGDASTHGPARAGRRDLAA